jgi:hypothetical protein
MEVSISTLKRGEYYLGWALPTPHVMYNIKWSTRTACKMLILTSVWSMTDMATRYSIIDGDIIEQLIRARQDMRNKNEKE